MERGLLVLAYIVLLLYMINSLTKVKAVMVRHCSLLVMQFFVSVSLCLCVCASARAIPQSPITPYPDPCATLHPTPRRAAVCSVPARSLAGALHSQR